MFSVSQQQQQPVRRGKGQRRKQRLRAGADRRGACGRPEEATTTTTTTTTPGETEKKAAEVAIDVGRDLLARARCLDRRNTDQRANTHLLPIQSMLVHRLAEREAFYSAYNTCSENLRAIAREQNPNSARTVLKRVPLDIDVVFWKHEGQIVREELWKNKHLVTLARAQRLHKRRADRRGACGRPGGEGEDEGKTEEEEIIELSDAERTLTIRRFGDHHRQQQPQSASSSVSVSPSGRPQAPGARSAPSTYLKAVFEEVVYALVPEERAARLFHHATRMAEGYVAPQTKEVLDPDPVGAVVWTHKKLRELLRETDNLPAVVDLFCARTDVFPTVLIYARTAEVAVGATETETETETKTKPAAPPRPPNVYAQLARLTPFWENDRFNIDLTIVHDTRGKIVDAVFGERWLVDLVLSKTVSRVLRVADADSDAEAEAEAEG